MRISVFGIGYVGAVSAACLANDGHDVIAVDTSQIKVDAINAGRSPIVEHGLQELIRQERDTGRLRAISDPSQGIEQSDVSFVCVGTPSLSNGSLDLTYVARVCEEIGRALQEKAAFHSVVIRSTMLPGSMRDVVIPILQAHSGKIAGEDFGIAIYPEFLREGTAIRDYYEAGTIVLGVQDERTETALRAINGKLPGKTFILDMATAEMVKYTNNAWHAAKIVFANEIGSICKSLSVDGQRVMATLCADTRLNVSTAYMKPGFAFGGSCLPKDLRALTYKARGLDVSVPMIDALLPSNEQQLKRAMDLVQQGQSRSISLIGLSFKGGTDDLRESPAVELAERLFGKGYDLRIYDHNVSYAKLTGSNLAYIQSRLPHLVKLLSGDLEEVIAHGDVVVLVHATAEERATLTAHMRADHYVVDLFGMSEKPRQLPRYEGLCW